MITRRKAITIGAAAAVVGTGGYLAMADGPSYESAVASVWQKKNAGAAGDLEYLAHYATLAANSHNTQPWLFRRNGSSIVISADQSRATPVVDPDQHHLFASLGCAAENLMLAAGDTGQSSALAFGGATGDEIEINLASGGSRDALFDAILDRQCTRSEFDNSSIAADELNALSVAAKVAGCDVVLITEKDRIESVVEQVVAANTRQVEDPAFVAELKSWLRFSAAQAITTGDGLYAACSGNPTMPQWLGNLVFGFVFTAASENDRYAKHIRSSSGLAVFVTDRDDKEHWVQAGRSYQRFALKATSLGIRNAFINQPVESADARSSFAAWLGTAGKRPNFIVRFGRGAAMPKSLRRPVRDVIAPA